MLFLFVVLLLCVMLMGAYLCRVEIDALYSLTPGTVHVSVVSSLLGGMSWARNGADRTYKSCLCGSGQAMLASIFCLEDLHVRKRREGWQARARPLLPVP